MCIVCTCKYYHTFSTLDAEVRSVWDRKLTMCSKHFLNFFFITFHSTVESPPCWIGSQSTLRANMTSRQSRDQIDFVVIKIDFAANDIDFAVAKMILSRQLWATVNSVTLNFIQFLQRPALPFPGNCMAFARLVSPGCRAVASLGGTPKNLSKFS